MDTASLLCNAFLRDHTTDAARQLERLSAEQIAEVLSQCDAEVAGDVLSRLTPHKASTCLSSMTRDHAAAIVPGIHLDLASALLRRVSKDVQNAILGELPAQVKEPLGRLLAYPPHTAGAMMDPLVHAIAVDITVGDALAHAHESPQQVMYYVYVVDREHNLVGVVNLRELMMAGPELPVSGMMHKHVARISAMASRDEIIRNQHWRQYHALPVVDANGLYLGVLRYETLRRLEQEQDGSDSDRHGVDTAMAVGELFLIGLSGMLGGVFAASGQPQIPRDSSRQEKP